MLKLCKRLHAFCQIFNSFQRRGEISRMLSANTATVRLVDNEKVGLCFAYRIESNEKLLTFYREKDERLSELFIKIRHKITQLLQKKKKRTKGVVNSTAIELTEEMLPIALFYEDNIVNEQSSHSDAWKEGSVLKVGDSNYKVIINAPSIKSLKLPKYLLSGIEIYPAIDVEFCNEQDCRYLWFKKRLPQEKQRKNSGQCLENESIVAVDGWFPVSNKFSYKPDDSDIGRQIKLKCIPVRNGIEGVESFVESQTIVKLGPGVCPFEDRHILTKEITNQGCFRCISYNLLADLYADSDYSRKELFPYCPPNYLDMNYRKQLLFKELLGYNGDVVCLQEVDRSLYKKELQQIMRLNELEGIFDEKGDQSGEGLACFYRRSKFELLAHSSINLSQCVETHPIFKKLKHKIGENKKFHQRLMARKTILQYALLKSVENPGKSILIGNTHLYFHPDSDHIRLIQSFVCVSFLEHLLCQYKFQHKDLKISPLLFGDFNSCPEFGVYKLMTTGLVDSECEDWKSNPEESLSDMVVSHSLSLSSACGTPQYTNFTKLFNGCLDYIFYDNSSLNVEEVIPLPSHDQITQLIAIPNEKFPSDHLALVATLKWKQPSF